jgi:MYXO-CTERM domain-containing protein
MTRTLIATALVSVAIATSAVAVNVLQAPDPSLFVLLAAGVLALVLLRRRTS